MNLDIKPEGVHFSPSKYNFKTGLFFQNNDKEIK